LFFSTIDKASVRALSAKIDAFPFRSPKGVDKTSARNFAELKESPVEGEFTSQVMMMVVVVVVRSDSSEKPTHTS
jgi:uncharacterized protein (DUF608 family)